MKTMNIKSNLEAWEYEGGHLEEHLVKGKSKMYPTKNSISEKSRIQMAGLLQIHLCNSIDLMMQAKQAHWNVKGSNFFGLHGFFDHVAESTERYVDQIAERIVQLGGTAEGTLQSTAKHTELPVYPLNISQSNHHLTALAFALATYGERIRSAISLAQELSDPVSVDIFTEISRGADKYLWLVESHLNADR